MPRLLSILFIFSLIIGGVTGAFAADDSGSQRARPKGKVTVVKKKDTDESNTPKYPDKIPDNVVVDSIAIHKADHQLLVFRNNRLLKIYPVQLGQTPVGAKHYAFDQKTPEGWYYISGKRPKYEYHKGLEISYPSAEDVIRAKKAGRLPGDGILIHGLPNSVPHPGPDRFVNDWTLGCIAMRNEMIDELFEHVDVNTPIFITP